MEMGRHGWMVAMALAFSAGHGVANAGDSRAEVRKQVEATMLLTGSLDIDADGVVSTYTFNQTEALPKAVLEVVDRRIRGWRFEPVVVHGKAVPVRSPMQMRLVAQQDGPNYQLRISGVTFYGKKGEGSFARGKLQPPRYPSEAVYKGVGGTVYLVLRVGRNGAVEDVVAEQVNLRIVGNEREMATYREWLASSAIKTARKWKFVFPTEGEDADAPFMSLRVPVDFIAPDTRLEAAGKWNAYVPGPRQGVPWRNWDASLQSPDAFASDRVYRDQPDGPRLLTNIDG